MQKRIRVVCGVSFLFLAACSGTPASDNSLPTLAKIPTNAPSATVVPSLTPQTVLVTPTENQELLPDSTTPDIAETDVFDVPSEPTATLLPADTVSLISVFPTLVAGEATTLQGQMTVIDDNHAKLTDSNGNTAIVLIDPFAAQIGANHLVQIHGTVETDGSQLVLRMTEIDVLDESTAEPETTDSP